jgi:hypothetical protein
VISIRLACWLRCLGGGEAADAAQGVMPFTATSVQIRVAIDQVGRCSRWPCLAGRRRRSARMARSWPPATQMGPCGCGTWPRTGWDVAYLMNVVPHLCASAGRSLTRAEWARYVPGLAYQRIARNRQITSGANLTPSLPCDHLRPSSQIMPTMHGQNRGGSGPDSRPGGYARGLLAAAPSPGTRRPRCRSRPAKGSGVMERELPGRGPRRS